jgi:hypothetical protein
MTFAIRFAVEGMPRCDGLLSTESPTAVLRALEAGGVRGARFDAMREVFTIELDPALISWSEVRELVRLAGEREGRVLLAVVMSL